MGHSAQSGDGGEPTGEVAGGTKPGGHAGLIGAGSSRVGISGAMRARDVSRVRPEDLAEAEREVRIRHASAGAGPAAAAPPPTGSPSPADTSTRSAKPKPGVPVPAPPPRRDPHPGGT